MDQNQTIPKDLEAVLGSKERPGDDVLQRATAVGVELAGRGQSREALRLMLLLTRHLEFATVSMLEILRSVPPPLSNAGDDKEFSTMLTKLLTILWTPPFEHARNVADITALCVDRFTQPLVARGTFAFGDYIHTSKCLGHGSEGNVFLGFHRPTGMPVAIKTIEKQSLLKSPAFAEEMDRQSKFLQETTHPSIVKQYGVEKLESRWHLYFEYLDGGDLESHLFEPNPARRTEKIRVVLSESKAREIFRKLLEPVSYLRKHAVIHRDLKPANFMMTLDGKIKLVDFSNMRDNMEPGHLAASIKGTPLYMAPEIWDRRRNYEGEKVDVWSMGVILYQMVCGKLPWNGSDVKNLLQNLQTQQLSLPSNLGLSKTLEELLRNTLKLDPALRMSWAELVEHEWLMDDPLSNTAMGTYLEEKASALELQVQRLEARCQVLTQAQQSKDNVIKELSREVQLLRGEQKARGQAQAQAESRFQLAVSEMEAQLKGALEKYEEMAAQRAHVQSEKDALVAAQLRQMEEARLSWEKREASLKEKVLMSTKQVVQLQERLTAASQQESRHSEEQVRLSATIEGLEKKMLALQKETTQSMSAADAALHRVNQVNEENRTLQKQLEEMKRANADLVLEKERLLEDVMSNLSKSSDGIQSQMQARIEQLEAQVADLENQKANLDMIIRQNFHHQ